jgi:hypothetical protein
MGRKKKDECAKCGVIKTTANCNTRMVKGRFYFQGLCKDCDKDRALARYREKMSQAELQRKIQKYSTILNNLKSTLTDKNPDEQYQPIADSPMELPKVVRIPSKDVLTQYEYHVTWEIEVTADSAQEAAEQALQIQRDPESTATIFSVYNLKIGGRVHTIDTSAAVDRWPQEDWREDVRNGYTMLGYEAWVTHNEESRLDSKVNVI